MISAAPLANVFSVRAGEYTHFTITEAGAKTIGLCVIALAVGVILAALYNFYLRRVPGGVARKLLDAGALSPETAKTAEELGLAGKRLALFELTRGNALSRFVRVVDKDKTAVNPGADGESATQMIGSGTAAAEATPDTEQETPETVGERTNQVIGSGPATAARYYIPEELKYRAEIRFDPQGNGLFALIFTCAAAVGLAALVITLLPWFLGVLDKMM